MLANFNLADDNPPNFVQINLGWRPTERDSLSIEAKTWRYLRPLGIPYGPSLSDPDENYPGFIRDFGLALTYQRFLWEGAYVALHTMHALQEYHNEDDDVFQRGYMLFLTYRLGYHIRFLNDRFFIEPSIAVTQWPIRTNVPEAFGQADERWNRYFLAEPGLHFGFNF